MPAKLSDELVARMWADYQRLKSLKQVAALYDRKFPTMQALFVRRGLLVPKSPRLSEERKQEIIALYAEHKSSYKVAKLIGRSPTSVWSFLKAQGLTIPKKRQPGVVYKGQKFTPDKDGFLRSTSFRSRQRGKSCFLHRLIWKEHRGRIPKGHEVMFRDKNRRNCTIENLICVSHAEARKLTYTGNGYTKWNARQRELARAVALLEHAGSAGPALEEARRQLAEHEANLPPNCRDPQKKRRKLLRVWSRRTPEQRAAVVASAQASKRAQRRKRFEALPQHAIALLDEREREILRRYYIEGETFEQIAPAFGLSAGGAHCVRKRALKKIPQLVRLLEERVASVEKWIQREATKYALRFQIDRDDLVQQGRLGALIAASRFQAGKGANYLTYAAYWIRQGMDRFGRDQSQQVRVPAHKFWSHRLDMRSLDAPLSTDDGDGSAYGEVHCSEDEQTTGAVDFGDRAQLVAQMLERLEPKEREILRLRFFEQQTLEVVGAQFGVTRERIRQIEAKSLRWLRQFAPEVKQLEAAA